MTHQQTTCFTLHETAPIVTKVEVDSSGTPRFFIGNSDVGECVDDIFEQHTNLTKVTVVVQNFTSQMVCITFDDGGCNVLQPLQAGQPPDEVDRAMTMPNPGKCTQMQVTAYTASEPGRAIESTTNPNSLVKGHDPIFRIKRQQGGVTPTCS